MWNQSEVKLDFVGPLLTPIFNCEYNSKIDPRGNAKKMRKKLAQFK